METPNRGRSPSTARQDPLERAPSPAPQSTTQQGVAGLDVDEAAQLNHASFGGSFSARDTTPLDSSFDFSSSSQPFSRQSAIAQTSLFPEQDLAQTTSGAPFDQQGSANFLEFGSLDNPAGLNGGFDEPLFPNSQADQTFLDSTALDPQLFDTQSAQHQHQQHQQHQQPLDFSPMTSTHHSPTPPHLLASPTMQRQSSSPHGSPAFQQGPFQPHSRHASLDPASAAHLQMQSWGGGDAFRGHRRSPSDAHSDVSSSAHPSPFLENAESFDPTDHHSPLLQAQQDTSGYQEVMQIGQFSISEPPPPYISPAHSPNLSPSLLPQQTMPPFTNPDSFGLSSGLGVPMGNQYNGQQGLEIFPGPDQSSFSGLNQNFGQAATMSPPEINIQLAPPSRQQSFEPVKSDAPEPGDTLTLPDRRSRNRVRATSDPISISSPRPETAARDIKDTLSPHAAGVGSRSPSPAGKGRRASTSSVNVNRDYILDLADPSRPNSNNSVPGLEGTNGSKRTQKHPATFQCSLCPKRFTRAYNLRSHLRTHTDERPFVCSVCGKAFARQHDRKRHEGLHSGEKKFICRGNLKDGGIWGCSRRFARADALGRHFRSEAGRVCIKPLLEEEALERMQHSPEQNNNIGMAPMAITQPLSGQPMMQQYGSFPGQEYNTGMSMNAGQPYMLPRALLAQYPTLGGIWNDLPNVADDDVSGRSSFDASSAGEYDEGDEYSGGPATGWASDVGAY